MLFPKGEIRHQNLLTAYTDLSALVTTLKSEGFSGSVEVEFPGSKGTLFVASGEIINAEARRGADSKRMIGQEAARHLLGLSNQKDGVLHVYRMPPDRVAIVTSTLQSEIIFKDLSSDFTRLDRLIIKLREERHNGFIEILTKEHKEMGILFFLDGEVNDLLTTSETGASLVDKKSILGYLENVVKQGVIFNVYRSGGKPPLKEAPPKEALPKEVSPKEAPPKEMPPKEVTSKEMPPREPLPKEAPPKGAPPKELTPKAMGGGVKDLIPFLQDLLSKVEKLVDGASRKGTFLSGFKRSLIEKSLDYPFLDPFAGEFEYREGTIVFRGETGARDFAKGIGESLRATLDLLEEEFPKNRILPVKLRAGIESSLEQYREGLKRLGVDSVLASIFQ